MEPFSLLYKFQIDQDFTRSTYAPVAVSTFTLSPKLMNKGTLISAPVSTVAFFNALVEVLPATAGISDHQFGRRWCLGGYRFAAFKRHDHIHAFF